MVATNGHRLAKMESTIAASSSASSDLIVPPKALDQVRRLFPAEEDLEIARGENHLGFRSPVTSVFTRLIEGPYPNYDQVIPRDNDRNRHRRQGSARRARSDAWQSSRQTRRTASACRSTPASVKFSVQTPDLGEAQDELPVRYTGDPLDIGFNAAYLLEILRYMPTEDVKLTFKAPERAATIEPEGWSDPAKYLCLVMPLRLVD